MVAAYTVQGDSFVADKPRLWSEKPLANLVNSRKNIDLVVLLRASLLTMTIENQRPSTAELGESASIADDGSVSP